MRRRLPCPKCGVAWLKDAKGGLVPYEMGIAPSAFLTRGKDFSYFCMNCQTGDRKVTARHVVPRQAITISKAAFMALPDLDAEAAVSVVVEMTPEEVQEGMARVAAEEEARAARKALITPEAMKAHQDLLAANDPATASE